MARSGLGPTLSAHRGKPGIDRPALVEALVRLSELACDLEEVARVRLRLPGAPAVQPSIRPYPPCCLRPRQRKRPVCVQVAASFQRKGLGLDLTNKMVQYLRDNGGAEISAQCKSENIALAALARHVGFEIVGSTARRYPCLAPVVASGRWVNPAPPSSKGIRVNFLKRVLTLDQWTVLLESVAAQEAALLSCDPGRAAKLQGVLDVFRTVPPGAFVEIRVGSNTLVD
ncbi:MAG: GNAT family N-acetyltransferase [Pseudomonadota bacterium]|nr:GNAT family N-acetyltransferase [Pseudomonadota bacterium]